MARSLRRGVLPVAATFGIIVAVGLVAAVLNQIDMVGIGPGVGPGAGQPSPGGDFGSGGPGMNRTAPEFQNETGGAQLGGSRIPLTTCIRFLTTPLGILAVIGGYAAFILLINKQYDAARASMTGYITAPAVFILYFALTQCPSLPNYGNPDVPGLGATQGGGGLASVPIPPEVLAIVFGLVFLGGVAMLFFAQESEEVIEPPEEEEEEPDMQQFAEAAGRAADRIEKMDADVDNAVYRAWKEMTDLLDMPDPETSTPGDFAARAIEAGMNEADVNDLTRLFNEVRYGGKDPESREDQAVQTLRNIEDQYTPAPAESGGEAEGETDAGAETAPPEDVEETSEDDTEDDR